MSRRHRAEKRIVLPDAKYKDLTVSKFMSCLMYDGKRSIAETIVYGAFNKIEERTGQQPISVFHEALDNIKPMVEVRSRRVGGATYQVPMEVRQERGIAMALRWLVTFSRARNGKSMAQKLAGELMDAANETGSAVKKREDTHKMAEANKAFAHYRY